MLILLIYQIFLLSRWVTGCCSYDNRNTSSHQWLEWLMFVNYWTAQNSEEGLWFSNIPFPGFGLDSVPWTSSPHHSAVRRRYSFKNLYLTTRLAYKCGRSLSWASANTVMPLIKSTSNKILNPHYFDSNYKVILVFNGRHFQTTQNILPFLRTGLIYCTQAPAHQMLLRSVLEFG